MVAGLAATGGASAAASRSRGRSAGGGASLLLLRIRTPGRVPSRALRLRSHSSQNALKRDCMPWKRKRSAVFWICSRS